MTNLLDKIASDMGITSPYLPKDERRKVIFDTESAMYLNKAVSINLPLEVRFKIAIAHENMKELERGNRWIKDRAASAVNKEILNFFNNPMVEKIATINLNDPCIEQYRVAEIKWAAKKACRKIERDPIEYTDINLLYHALGLYPTPVAIISEDSHILDSARCLRSAGIFNKGKGYKHLFPYSLLGR